MKKLNIITLLVLCITVVGTLTFASCSDTGKTDPKADASSEQNFSDTVLSSDKKTPAADEINSAPDSIQTTPESFGTEPASMADALFIGDSRTVGIMEYAGLNDADFFCSVGMNVFDIFKTRVSVPRVGKVTLNELLPNKKYGKIYLMLGINELGYNFKSIINKYGELIEFIKNSQPDAQIFIQANLHVSKKRSDGDGYINNTAIDKLNSELSKFADNKRIYYIDANCLFDDDNGNLSADKTSDNAHLYAKYYVDWGEWICKETAKCIEGE